MARQPGDAVLDRLRRGLSDVARKKVHDRISVAGAAELLVDDKAKLRAGRSPGGARLRRLRYRRGTPLVLSGALYLSLQSYALRRGGIIMRATVPYARYHLSGVRGKDGKTIVPKRKFLPGAGIPKPWRAKLDALRDAAFRAAIPG